MKSRKRRFIQNTSEDDSEKENDELRLHFTIAPDEEKEVDYEILDRKYPIKEWKTECLGTKPQVDKAEHLEEINQNVDWNIVSWKLHGSSGVHTLVTEIGLVIHMLVEKKYPLRKKELLQMLELKLESEEDSTMALELIRFVKKLLAELEPEDSDGIEKGLRFSTHLASLVKSWLVQDQIILALASPKSNELTIPEQTATGKGTSNPLMAGDENPIRTLGDYSKPSHEGYRNTIKLTIGNNVVPLGSNTIRLVQNECSFHGLWSEDPNQHLKDFLKLVDSLDLDGENKDRHICVYSNFPFVINLAIGLTVFQQDPSPHGRILLLVSLLNSFYLEGLQNSAMTSLCSNNIKKSLSQKHELVSRTYSKNSLIMALIFCSKNAEESWALLEDLALYDNERWNDPRDFAKPVKAISLPQDVSSTSDRHLTELENQLQRLMEAHLSPTQPTQVNKITSLCEICRSPYDTYVSQSNLEGLVSNFMASQEARFSKFEADFKQQQSEMTNKINTILKAITDRIVGTLPSDTVKNPKLSTYLILFACSYPTVDPQCSLHHSTSINAIKTCSKEANISHTIQLQPRMGSGTQQPEEPKPTLEDEFQDLHLNLPVLEVLAYAPIYNTILDKYVEILKLGKNGLAFIQGEVSTKIEDPGLFTLPCRLGDSKPFDTLADLGSCVNIIPLYLFKKLNTRLLEETDHIFGLADGIKSYPVGIVKDVEVHIGKLKLLNDFYLIDMKKDPKTPLLVGRGFLATANGVIDCRRAKIVVGEGIARSVFGVRCVDLDCHLPGEWEIARDAEINPFKDVLVFKRMVKFLGAIPINLKSNMWESKDLINNPINWNKPPKNGDRVWHAKIKLIDPDREVFTKTLQSIPTTRKLSERESLREIIDLDHFYGI
ncbi:MAK10-like protein [Tanacetum coccineum]